MSITFTIGSIDDEGVVNHGCGVDHRADLICLGTCSDPSDFTDYGCCDCTEAAELACPICSVELNVSNANAAAILERLGLEADEYGVLDPADMLGRVMVGNIGRSDDGMADSVSVGSGGAINVDCGVRAGYFADRFGALADLVMVASDRNMLVVWG